MPETLVLSEIQKIGLLGTILLVTLPGALTDYQSGKIKNWLIIFLLFMVIGGIFLIWKTLDLTFWISAGVVLGFGYVLYLYDRWGAGDGKYFIVLGWILLLLEKILQISPKNLLWFTLLSFGGLALWIIVNLFWKMRGRWNTLQASFSLSRDILILWGVFSVITSLLIPYFPPEVRSIGIALLFFILGSYIHTLSLGIFAPVVLGGSIVFALVYGSFWTLGLSIVFLVIFRIIEQISEQAFEIVDTREITLIELQQGDILSSKSREALKKLLDIEVGETPLQGHEVFELLSKAQSLKLEKTPLQIFQSIKMGIILYGALVIVLLGNLVGLTK